MIKKIGFALLALAIFGPTYVQAVPGIFTVNLEGISTDVSYDAEGVEILSIEPDLDFISLILEVEVTGSPGILEITFDREFFDATFQGTDDSFIVIADGDEPDFEETVTTPASRTFRIELPNGTEEVEIIGTVFGQLTSAPEPEPPAPEPEPEPPAPEPEPPVTEEPETTEEPEVTEEPKTQCGPGTVLSDGVCVLEECGPGTILQDGECVSTKPSEVSTSKDFIVGGGIALGIALIAIIILAAIARASRTKN